MSQWGSVARRAAMHDRHCSTGGHDGAVQPAIRSPAPISPQRCAQVATSSSLPSLPTGRQADTVQWARCLSLLACNAVCGVWRRVGPGRTDFRGTQYPLRWCTALSIQRAGLAQEERSIETRIWQVHPLGSSGARKSWARSRACCQAVSLDSTAPRVAGGTPAGTTLHASRSSSRQSSARGRIPNNSSTAAA